MYSSEQVQQFCNLRRHIAPARKIFRQSGWWRSWWFS